MLPLISPLMFYMYKLEKPDTARKADFCSRRSDGAVVPRT